MPPCPQDHAGSYPRGSPLPSHRVGQLDSENPLESQLTLQGFDIVVDVAGGLPSFATETPFRVFGRTIPSPSPSLSHANGSLTIFPSSSLHTIVRRNTYQATTITNGATRFSCEGVCVAGVVVAAIVVSCFSIGLFLCLISGCRRKMNGWIENYYGGQRRTNPSVVDTPIRLEPGRSQVSTTFIEFPPLPPYPGNHLPPYSLSDSDASVNRANASSETDHESSDVSPTREFNIAPEDINSEVTSANTTIGNDNESPVPPTPSTIPLPHLSNNDHIPRRDSSSDSENDNLHQCCSDNQPVNIE